MANAQDFEPEKTELLLYIDNESSIYNQKKAIIENMKRKIGQGKYSPEAAVKGWLYWVDAGARQYCKENRCDLRATFPLPLRTAVAKEVSIREKELIDNGEYGAVATPKSAKGKMPKLEVSSIKLNRQGYASNGTYYGVGAKVFQAFNPDNGEYVTFRAQHRPMALGVLRNMFEKPEHASVTDRFTPGQVRKFTES